jgi:hypothetical protein
MQSHYRELAAHWRSLAALGDPAERQKRIRWAEDLEQLADCEEQLRGEQAGREAGSGSAQR